MAEPPVRADRLRTAPLLTVLVEAELRSGKVDAAEAASTHAAGLARETATPMVAAHAALAAGYVAAVYAMTLDRASSEVGRR